MFSTVENEYIIGLINTYYGKGYKHYLCHTITENGNDYDFVLYVSKEKIGGINDNYFDIKDALRLYVDSSSRSTYNSTLGDKVSSFTGYITVDQGEFIYTNAECNYNLSTIPLNPDITIDYKQNHVDVILLIVITIFCVYSFIKDLFNIGGR